MKLTQEQINYLFSFCRGQGIIHYDVQIEMVDHFTEWIETNWKKQPYASFLFMIAQLRESFPKQDLKEIVREKEANLKKELVRQYKTEIVSFFTLPKIALSLLLFVFFFTIQWKPWLIVSLPVYLLNAYTVLYYLFAGKNIVRKNKEQKIHPLLVYDKLERLLNVKLLVAPILFIAVSGALFAKIKIEHDFILYPIRILIPFILIAFFSLVHVSVQVNKKIRKLYPTAFAL
ncbi:MAG: hypothetical protein ABL872_06880 [Lacibacter sp.]